MADRSRSIRAGRAAVELYADDSRLIRGLRQAERRIRQFGQRVAAIGRQFAAVGAAGSAAFAGAAVQFARYGDELDKLSTRTGISVEALSELGFAAERTGTSLDGVGNAVQRMNRRLGRITAGQGSGQQVSALEQLGLDAQRLEQLDPEGRLLALADAVAKYGDQAEAAGLAQRAFGTQVDEILPLLLQGRDGIKALTDQARDLGRTVSGDDADAAARLSDAFGTLAGTLKDTVFEIGAAVSGGLTGAIEAINRIAVAVNQWVEENRDLVRQIALITAAVAGVGGALLVFSATVSVVSFAISGVATTVGVAVAATKAFGVALAAVASPAGVAITAIAAAGGAILAYTGAAGDAVKWLGDRFGALVADVDTALTGIQAALTSGDLETASEILWLGLKTVWANGVNALKTLWIDLKTSILRTGSEAFTGLLAAAEWSYSQLLKLSIEFNATLLTLFTSLGASIKNIWADTVNFVAKQMLELRGLVDENFDADAAIEIRQSERDANRQQFNRARDRFIVDIEARRRRQLRSERAAHEREIAAIVRADRERISAIEKNAAAAKAAADEELARLRAQLNQATREATENAEAARERRGDASSPTGLPNVDDFLARIRDGIEAGTASASAAARGGFDARNFALASGVNQDDRETAENTRETVRILRRISQQRGLTFGS